jgi:hypothetical protein
MTDNPETDIEAWLIKETHVYEDKEAKLERLQAGAVSLIIVLEARIERLEAALHSMIEIAHRALEDRS